MRLRLELSFEEVVLSHTSNSICVNPMLTAVNPWSFCVLQSSNEVDVGDGQQTRRQLSEYYSQILLT